MPTAAESKKEEGARPDEYLGEEETVRAEKNRIHLKRENLSVAVAVGKEAWAGGNDGALVTEGNIGPPE